MSGLSVFATLVIALAPLVVKTDGLPGLGEYISSQLRLHNSSINSNVYISALKISIFEVSGILLAIAAVVVRLYEEAQVSTPVTRRSMMSRRRLPSMKYRLPRPRLVKPRIVSRLPITSLPIAHLPSSTSSEPAAPRMSHLRLRRFSLGSTPLSAHEALFTGSAVVLDVERAAQALPQVSRRRCPNGKMPGGGERVLLFIIVMLLLADQLDAVG